MSLLMNFGYRHPHGRKMKMSLQKVKATYRFDLSSSAVLGGTTYDFLMVILHDLLMALVLCHLPRIMFEDFDMLFICVFVERR